MKNFVKIGILIAVGIVLNIIERFIVIPVPFVRLGLSYIVILIGLYLFSIGTGYIIAVLKVLVSSFVFGYFLHPIFFVSFSANAVAVLVMSIMIKLFENQFSPVGVSVIGAVSFNFTQLFVVYILFIKRVEIFSFLPVVMIISVVTGFFIGFIGMIVIENLKKQYLILQNME